MVGSKQTDDAATNQQRIQGAHVLVPPRLSPPQGSNISDEIERLSARLLRYATVRTIHHHRSRRARLSATLLCMSSSRVLQAALKLQQVGAYFIPGSGLWARLLLILRACSWQSQSKAPSRWCCMSKAAKAAKAINAQLTDTLAESVDCLDQCSKKLLHRNR
jgi:hypothetical protein